jgi:hypothetical protein
VTGVQTLLFRSNDAPWLLGKSPYRGEAGNWGGVQNGAGRDRRA